MRPRAAYTMNLHTNMHYVLLFCLLLAGTPAGAQTLASNLRALVPGNGQQALGERQYLHGKVEELFAQLRREEKLDRRSKKKRVKHIQNFLEREVLRTYAAHATLDEVFRNGRYNDATGAALTALLLSEFNVPYEIYVDHWTVGILADPQGKERRFAWHPDWKDIDQADRARYRRLYLGFLRNTILPDLPEPLDNEEARTVYRQYHYRPAAELDLKDYGAYLLYRRAQSSYHADDAAGAVRLLDAALSVEERPAFLALRHAAELRLTARAGNLVRGSLEELFAQFREDPTNDYLAGAILQYFDEQQRLILASNKPEKTRELLARYLAMAPLVEVGPSPLHEHVPNWSRDMMQLQNLRLLEHYLIADDLPNALQQAEELYLGFPDSTAYQRIFSDVALRQLRRQAGGAEDLHRRLAQLAEQYPFIRRSDAYIDLDLRQKALTVRDRFAEDRLDEARAALRAFDDALLGVPIGPDRSLWTLTAYYAASDYYFRNRDYTRAIDFIDKALVFGPEEAFLLHRRAVLSRYL